MAIQIKHSFQSAKGDGGDATLVRPSDWNAAHTTSMATGNVIGRRTAGAGAFEEIPISDFGAALLNSSDASGFGFTTGDTKFTFKTAPDTGWIFATGTIGNASSGASNRANADVQALYVLIYNATAPDPSNNFPVSGGRTGNALNDFNAGKTLNLGNMPGRILVPAGPGFSHGGMFGEAQVTLGQAQLPAIRLNVGVSGSLSVTTSSTADTWVTGGFAYNSQGGGATIIVGSGNGTVVSTGTASGSMTGETGLLGSGLAHNNYQPGLCMNLELKL